jgi:hypothetical protein
VDTSRIAVPRGSDGRLREDPFRVRQERERAESRAAYRITIDEGGTRQPAYVHAQSRPRAASPTPAHRCIRRAIPSDDVMVRERAPRQTAVASRSPLETPPLRRLASAPARSRTASRTSDYATAPRSVPTLRLATPGRRLRRGATLAGRSRHDCASTARRHKTRAPVGFAGLRRFRHDEHATHCDRDAGRRGAPSQDRPLRGRRPDDPEHEVSREPLDPTALLDARSSRHVPRAAYTRRALHPPQHEARRVSSAASDRRSRIRRQNLSNQRWSFKRAAPSRCYGRCA